ncbi:MAG: ABC transporter ATP-binding protein [Nitrospinales bacterium]
MQNDNIILSVRNLCKYFPVYTKGFLRKAENHIRAVDNISFDLYQSQTFGLVGESGCGKTTAARLILRALSPTYGKILFKVNGDFIDLSVLSEKKLKSLRPKMQMIFQDPFSSLNPRMTIGDIVGEPLRIHKLEKGRRLKDRVKQILSKVGLTGDYINRYPHAFSGGQRQRIGIARALILNPSLIIADEAVSALDVSVQAQILNLLMDLQAELGLTYFFVSHDLGVVRHICNRVAVMYAGRIVELSDTQKIFKDPKHPYTKLLLRSIPYPDPDIMLDTSTTGEVADLAELPKGCNFAPRCPFEKDACMSDVPKLKNIGENHFIACFLYP